MNITASSTPKIVFPTDAYLAQLDSYEETFNKHIARQIKFIYSINKGYGFDAADRLDGIARTTIHRYAHE